MVKYFFRESVNTDSQEVLAEHALQQTLFDTAEQKAERTGGYGEDRISAMPI